MAATEVTWVLQTSLQGAEDGGMRPERGKQGSSDLHVGEAGIGRTPCILAPRKRYFRSNGRPDALYRSVGVRLAPHRRPLWVWISVTAPEAGQNRSSRREISSPKALLCHADSERDLGPGVRTFCTARASFESAMPCSPSGNPGSIHRPATLSSSRRPSNLAPTT